MSRQTMFLMAGAIALATARPAFAQDHAPADDDPPRVTRTRTPAPAALPADLRVLLGVTLTYSRAERDTLGALVSGVAADGPAERAGIDVGNRIAAINAISLRPDPESIGDLDAGNASIRRAARALASLEPGEEVELRVFSGGRFRTVVARIAVPSRVVGGVEAVGGRGSGVGGVRSDDEETRVATPVPAVPNAVTLASTVDAVAAAQAQIRQLAQREGAGPALDSLTALEQELGAIRRRLRAVQLSGDRATTRASASERMLEGISLSAVADELVPVLGEGSESGLLVLKADESWDPIRPGDVILRVNDQAATVERLRAARNAGRASTIDLLRRKREISVVLDTQ
ncbi:MAG TPA: hypothetical protein VF761_09650 [Gemmatimonadaceae bacterium]